MRNTCPVSTEGWTRRVHFVREGGGSGTAAARARLALVRRTASRRPVAGEAGRGALAGGGAPTLSLALVLARRLSRSSTSASGP